VLYYLKHELIAGGQNALRNFSEAHKCPKWLVAADKIAEGSRQAGFVDRVLDHEKDWHAVGQTCAIDLIEQDQTGLDAGKRPCITFPINAPQLRQMV
jgi:hypothetical protein